MEKIKIESRYPKLCSKFKAVITCMKTAFLQTRLSKLLMCLLIKWLGQTFVSKHAVEPLKGSCELLKHSAGGFEGLRENQKLGLEFEKLGRVFEKFGRIFVL